MTGKPKDQHKYETDNTIQPTLTDRLNKYLLCVYLDRLNKEDNQSGNQQFACEDDTENEETLAMDIFEENEFENFVENRGDEDVDKYLEPQDHDEPNDQDEEKRIVPVKIRVRNPQPKLNPERLRGTRGLSVLPTWFENIQFKGKGHESEDLNAVINRLEQWTHRLFPRYTFDDSIDKLEKLGKKNEIKVMLKRIRMDMDINNCVTQIEDDVVEPSPPQIDVFDQIANTVDIFPVTSTPSVSSTGLTEEQRQRMMRNRMMAEERRQAKIRARQKQEVNASFNASPVSFDSL